MSVTLIEGKLSQKYILTAIQGENLIHMDVDYDDSIFLLIHKIDDEACQYDRKVGCYTVQEAFEYALANWNIDLASIPVDSWEIPC